MPQVFIDHSDNVNATHLKAILPSLHAHLVESLPTELSTCKSRITSHQNYLIADGNPRLGFIHVDVKILPGREEGRINTVAKTISTMIADHFKDIHPELDLKISVAIDLLPLSYCRANV